jgi:plasmid stability protein
MKNVTIALDDETHRQARIRAAEMGTSLSALVKDYLISLSNTSAPQEGVREMQMPYKAAPAAAPSATPVKGPDGQPYFVNGKWTFTKDGNPRKPGSMKGKLWVADDFDETPEWLIDAFYGIGSNEPWPDPE